MRMPWSGEKSAALFVAVSGRTGGGRFSGRLHHRIGVRGGRVGFRVFSRRRGGGGQQPAGQSRQENDLVFVFIICRARRVFLPH